jgi:hypothetical protein
MFTRCAGGAARKKYQLCSRMNTMTKKVIDLMTYRIEKTLKENGFEVKKDDNKNIKILIKLTNNE